MYLISTSGGNFKWVHNSCVVNITTIKIVCTRVELLAHIQIGCKRNGVILRLDSSEIRISCALSNSLFTLLFAHYKQETHARLVIFFNIRLKTANACRGSVTKKQTSSIFAFSFYSKGKRQNHP